MVEFWSVGKEHNGIYSALIEKYTSLCSRYHKLQIVYLSRSSKGKALKADEQKRKEATEITQRLGQYKTRPYLVLLDENGREYRSVIFANQMNHLLTHKSQNRLVFLAGGAYGFDQEIYDIADENLALSKMTFPHDLVRVIFLEQLYRAFTILNNEKYHNE